MQRIGKSLEIGSYELELYREETAQGYAALPAPSGEDMSLRLFHYLLPRGAGESLAFLKELGIDPAKLGAARPLTEPDENGEVLFLCTASLCGVLKKGGDTIPRQSEEAAGLSMVFVGEERELREDVKPAFSPQVEMRFVIPLPFDASFFEGL